MSNTPVAYTILTSNIDPINEAQWLILIKLNKLNMLKTTT